MDPGLLQARVELLRGGWGSCGTLPTGTCALVKRKVTPCSRESGILYLRERSVFVCLTGKAPPRSQYIIDLLREVEELQAPGACGYNLDMRLLPPSCARSQQQRHGFCLSLGLCFSFFKR